MNNVIVVASSNKGKLKEIKEIFKDYDVLSLKEIEDKLGKEIIFNENQSGVAYQKDSICACGCPVFAADFFI